MKRQRYDYSFNKIVNDWKRDKSQGYAVRLAKKHNVPITVIHNVIYRHRKKKAEFDRRYREKKNGILPIEAYEKPVKKVAAKNKIIKFDQDIFRNHVVTASPMTVRDNRMIIV